MTEKYWKVWTRFIKFRKLAVMHSNWFWVSLKFILGQVVKQFSKIVTFKKLHMTSFFAFPLFTHLQFSLQKFTLLKFTLLKFTLLQFSLLQFTSSLHSRSLRSCSLRSCSWPSCSLRFCSLHSCSLRSPLLSAPVTLLNALFSRSSFFRSPTFGTAYFLHSSAPSSFHFSFQCISGHFCLFYPHWEVNAIRKSGFHFLWETMGIKSDVKLLVFRKVTRERIILFIWSICKKIAISKSVFLGHVCFQMQKLHKSHESLDLETCAD